MTPPTSTMKTPSVGAPLSASLHLPPKSGFSTEQTAYRLLSANLPTMNRIAIKHAPTAVQAYRTVARPPALATITVPAPTPYVPAARPVVKRTPSARRRPDVPRRQRSGGHTIPILPTAGRRIVPVYAIKPRTAVAGSVRPLDRSLMTAIGRSYYDLGQYDSYLSALDQDSPAFRTARLQLRLPVGWDCDESKAGTLRTLSWIKYFHNELRRLAAEDQKRHNAQILLNEARRASMKPWSYSRPF
ncbi:hypothetical protein P389DRAFT_196128 [Cystobasidium minutum MCA 4210]|uniref:uncharacterized protein n=1 Tax=Cystobasidium minutum MCA 4210 TaxID=1397322 RepID=UPI0034CD39A3|eukprot:jgi/Rhomi1/196128/gm1.4342_g